MHVTELQKQVELVLCNMLIKEENITLLTLI
jgi:hypothetical protein